MLRLGYVSNDLPQIDYMKSRKLYISTEHKMDSLMAINDIDFWLLVVFGEGIGLMYRKILHLNFENNNFKSLYLHLLITSKCLLITSK